MKKLTNTQLMAARYEKLAVATFGLLERAERLPDAVSSNDRKWSRVALLQAAVEYAAALRSVSRHRT